MNIKDNLDLLKKSLLLLILLISVISNDGQIFASEQNQKQKIMKADSLSENNETDEVLKPVHRLFEAMREHDKDKLLSQFTSSAILQRAEQDGSVRQSNIQEFAEFVARSKKRLDERIFDLSVQVEGKLATVWAPFKFYLDGELSHCGVNSFQLVNTAEGWKIQYLIDTTYAGDCAGWRRDRPKN